MNSAAAVVDPQAHPHAQNGPVERSPAAQVAHNIAHAAIEVSKLAAKTATNELTGSIKPVTDAVIDQAGGVIAECCDRSIESDVCYGNQDSCVSRITGPVLMKVAECVRQPTQAGRILMGAAEYMDRLNQVRALPPQQNVQP